MNSKALIVPMMPYLPTSHGWTGVLMALTGYLALALVVWVLRKPKTTADGLF